MIGYQEQFGVKFSVAVTVSKNNEHIICFELNIFERFQLAARPGPARPCMLATRDHVTAGRQSAAADRLIADCAARL